MPRAYASHDVQVEEMLALALRVAVDPSFVLPEWAVVLTGVLIASYRDQIPEGVRDDVLDQCRRLLEDVERRVEFPPALRAAAGALLSEWQFGFPSGLRRVAEACISYWPEAGPAP